MRLPGNYVMEFDVPEVMENLPAPGWAAVMCRVTLHLVEEPSLFATVFVCTDLVFLHNVLF